MVNFGICVVVRSLRVRKVPIHFEYLREKAAYRSRSSKVFGGRDSQKTGNGPKVFL